MLLNWLGEMKNSATFKSISNKDRWVIDSECSQHISSNRKMFFLYTLIQRGEVFMKNSATGKVNGEGTIQFRSHDGCITTLQGVRQVPESRYNLISLGALQGEEFCFSSKSDLIEVSKEAHVIFKPNVSTM